MTLQAGASPLRIRNERTAASRMGKASAKSRQPISVTATHIHSVRTKDGRTRGPAREEVGNRTLQFQRWMSPPTIAHTGRPSVSSFRVQRSSVHTTPAPSRPAPFRPQPVAAVSHGGRNQKDFAEDESFEAQCAITHIELARAWEGGPTWSTAKKRRDGPASLVRAATAP